MSHFISKQVKTEDNDGVINTWNYFPEETKICPPVEFDTISLFWIKLVNF